MKKTLVKKLKNIITGTDVETEEHVPGNQIIPDGMNPQGNGGQDGNSNKDAVEDVHDQDGQDCGERETEKNEPAEAKPTVDDARIEAEHPQDDVSGTLTREFWDYIQGTDKMWTFCYRSELKSSASRRRMPSRQSHKMYCTAGWSPQF